MSHCLCHAWPPPECRQGNAPTVAQIERDHPELEGVQPIPHTWRDCASRVLVWAIAGGICVAFWACVGVGIIWPLIQAARGR